MLNKLLGAAAMAAVAYAVVPASAAKMEGCSGGNLTKTESMIETMADGEGKIMAQKEIAQAQDAMLNGKRMRDASEQGDARGHDEVSLARGPIAPGDRPFQVAIIIRRP
jgi:hypothetical protein